MAWPRACAYRKRTRPKPPRLKPIFRRFGSTPTWKSPAPVCASQGASQRATPSHRYPLADAAQRRMPTSAHAAPRASCCSCLEMESRSEAPSILWEIGLLVSGSGRQHAPHELHSRVVSKTQIKPIPGLGSVQHGPTDASRFVGCL